MDVVISTGDKDFAQLVGPHITLVNTMTNTATDAAGVVAFCGVPDATPLWFSALKPDGKPAADSVSFQVRRGELKVLHVRTTRP